MTVIANAIVVVFVVLFGICAFWVNHEQNKKEKGENE